MPVNTEDLNVVFIALLVAAAVLGIASIPGTSFSGFAHPIVLFVGVFIGMLLLGRVLDNAAAEALDRSPREHR
ncbi:MAG: hypothetical protein WCK58_02565 [Chloroflexota bacterium]